MLGHILISTKLLPPLLINWKCFIFSIKHSSHLLQHISQTFKGDSYNGKQTTTMPIWPFRVSFTFYICLIIQNKNRVRGGGVLYDKGFFLPFSDFLFNSINVLPLSKNTYTKFSWLLLSLKKILHTWDTNSLNRCG